MTDIDATKALQELHVVTREAGVTHAAVSAAVNDYIRGNGTFSYLVERLRELALDAAEKIATQRHDDHIMDVQHAHDEGIAEGERRERASVVAWLDSREEELNAEGEAAQIEGHRTWAFDCASEAARAALAIERGDHRTEGEP